MNDALTKCQQAYDNMQPDDNLPDRHQYTGDLEVEGIRFDFVDGDLVNVAHYNNDGDEIHDGSFETWTDPRRNELHDLAHDLAYDKWLDDVREGKYDDY